MATIKDDLIYTVDIAEEVWSKAGAGMGGLFWGTPEHVSDNTKAKCVVMMATNMLIVRELQNIADAIKEFQNKIDITADDTKKSG